MRILALAALFAVAADGKWLRLEAGPFTLYTDGTEKMARDTLEKLDLAQRVLSGVGRQPLSLPLPVTVYTLVSESKFLVLRTGEFTRGFYQSAALRDSIVLVAGPDFSRVVFHEFVHLVLNHTTGPLPKWLEEGFAEFHSTLEVSNGKVRLGRPVENHMRLLAVAPWISAEEIAALTTTEKVAQLGRNTPTFYAQSWALVHMLRLHERYRSGFSNFFNAVASGESTPAALQRVYGKSLADLMPELKEYLDRTALPVIEQRAEAAGAPIEIRKTELSEVEGELAYAELALDTRRPEEAQKVYRKLRRHGESAQVTTALGLIALSEKRTDEARRLFEAAIRMPDADAKVFFEYAMLQRDSGSREDQLRYLAKAIAANPQFAEAHFLMGVELANDNRHSDALSHLEHAVSIFPRQSYFWHALALSYNAVGRADDSRRAAQRALDSAATSDQAEMARAALRLSVKPEAGSTEKRPGVITPEGWRKSQGDSRLEGILERIDCLGTSARFVVRSPSGPVPLYVENPGDILLKNLSSVTFEFRCGVQKPTPIVVEYRAKTDPKLGVAGVVTAIEFR